MPPEFAIFILITFPDTHGGFHRAFACTTYKKRLWQKTHPHFQNRDVREAQLREMANALQATG